MTPQTTFLIMNNLALVPWIMLIVFRNKKITDTLVRSGFFCVVFALVYVASLGISIAFPDPASVGASFNSLEGVKKLFLSDWGVVAGWAHYLAFDLLVGIQVDKILKDRSPILRTVSLFFTLMLGPVGWLIAKAATFKKEA